MQIGRRGLVNFHVYRSKKTKQSSVKIYLPQFMNGLEI